MGKKLRFLLLNLPWHENGRYGVRAGSRWPHTRDKSESGYVPFPFFLAYSAALLKTAGIEVSIIDAVAQRMHREQFFEAVKVKKPDYAVIETSVASFNNDLAYARELYECGIKIILCGPNAQIYSASFLQRAFYVSYVLFGEYERTLLKLAVLLQEERQPMDLEGLIYRKNGTPVMNKPVQPLDVDSLPWPERENLPMDRYFDAPCGMPYPNVQMMASRGCPYSCSFCLWPQLLYGDNRYRPRRIADVVDEMEFLVRDKKFKSVYFDDDIFNIDKNRMLDFCSEIKHRGMQDVPWAIMARPDLMDEETLENMKKAGLWAVKYGVETADEAMLKSVVKDIDLARAQSMIRFTKDLGIRTHLTFILGLPGETRESIKRTVDLAVRLDPYSVQFSIVTPFPGTRCYQEYKSKGLLVSDDLSLYDGFSKSVIRTDELGPQDLEEGLRYANEAWGRHLETRANKLS